MSLDGFQQAFADAVGSPRRCLELRRDPSLLDGYDLDDRERRRLLAIVAHDGMSHNCTLYRANRLTPLARSFPRTCDVLGDQLATELEEFWRVQPDTEIQFRLEAERFADHLVGRIDAGAIDVSPDLRAVLIDERGALDELFGLVHHP